MKKARFLVLARALVVVDSSTNPAGRNLAPTGLSPYADWKAPLPPVSMSSSQS